MKEEIWNGHKIRFVEIGGEWWAVAKDIATALNFRDAFNATAKIPVKHKGTYKVSTPSGDQEMIILSELGIYRLIMRSNKPEAEDFQEWVCEMLKTLRKAAGLEGFEIFRMLDKEHQREAMRRLSEGLSSVRPLERVDFIKANAIANKAVSTRYGYDKMVKKGDMPPEMLAERQALLEDTVNLMLLNERYNMGLSVSAQIYRSAKTRAAS